jgi:hypothetical protein
VTTWLRGISRGRYLARYLDDADYTTAIFYENIKLRRKEKRRERAPLSLNYDYVSEYEMKRILY